MFHVNPINDKSIQFLMNAKMNTFLPSRGSTMPGPLLQLAFLLYCLPVRPTQIITGAEIFYGCFDAMAV
jgi:hypothetical protein